MNSDQPTKKFSKWTSVNTKIFKMYKDSFNRVTPGTLKEVEFISYRKLEKLSTFNQTPSLSKSPNLNEFLRNHVSLTPGTKIVELPMSPFGKHTSYNEEKDFKQKHFLNSSSTENRSLEKQIKLLRKRINSNLKNAIVKKKGFFRAHQFADVFKTNGGSLFSDVVRNKYLVERKIKEGSAGGVSGSSTVKDLRSFGKSSEVSVWKGGLN